MGGSEINKEHRVNAKKHTAICKESKLLLHLPDRLPLPARGLRERGIRRESPDTSLRPTASQFSASTLPRMLEDLRSQSLRLRDHFGTSSSRMGRCSRRSPFGMPSSQFSPPTCLGHPVRSKAKAGAPDTIGQDIANNAPMTPGTNPVVLAHMTHKGFAI